MGERKRAVSKNVRAGAARVRENVRNFRVFRVESVPLLFRPVFKWKRP